MVGEAHRHDSYVGVLERIDANLSRVRWEGRLVPCSIRGKLIRYRATKTNIAVGDRVKFRLSELGEGVIEEVLPRRNALSRPTVMAEGKEQVVAANIDEVLVVVSAREPALRVGLIDRYLAIAEWNKLVGVICLNKIDLDDEGGARRAVEVYAGLGYRVLHTCALTGKGVEALREALTDRLTVLVGHSGVGKSSLVNAVAPDLQLPTREVSRATGKGRHATSSATLMSLPFGGYIVDTPGVREFGLWNVTRRELFHCFPEIAGVSAECRFRSCLHVREPGCAVMDGVEKGSIARSRYESYLRVLESLPER